MLSQLNPQSVDNLSEFYSSGIHFIDPVNEGRGLEDLKVIYADLFKQLKNIKIDVVESHGDESSAFLKWTMRYRFRGRERELPGVSHFKFDSEGKVSSQRDYWDAATGVYSEFPGVGLTLRSLRKLVQVSSH